MHFEVQPIAYVRNSRKEAIDDNWNTVISEIVLNEDIPGSALVGLEAFSHAEIIFLFHRAQGQPIVLDAAHPRENDAWPKVGIFAQRKKNRPNLLGSTIVEICQVNGRTLSVKSLDAIDGTPVIDIKPVMREFLPQNPVRQPAWSTELMKNYW